MEARLPSTNNPSPDGVHYLDGAYSVVGQLLKAQGYTELDINTNRNDKNVSIQCSVTLTRVHTDMLP